MHPDGDHLTLLNVYHAYKTSECSRRSGSTMVEPTLTTMVTADPSPDWCWKNYLSYRALQQADNVRAQLRRTMERYDLDLVSTDFNDKKYYTQIRQVIAASFFMQCAHREGEKNSYMTIKDNQVVSLHPSCGLETNPEWVIYFEFVLTSRNYIRTVTEVRPEWLLDFAPLYFDVKSFPDGAAKRDLLRIINKKQLKASGRDAEGADGGLKKKRKKDKK